MMETQRHRDQIGFLSAFQTRGGLHEDRGHAFVERIEPAVMVIDLAFGKHDERLAPGF
jgi:hypothetical protein